jgi:hypothetical protein
MEQLETRLVPAQLQDAYTVVFQDIDGDNATVQFSQPVLNAGNVNTFFKFSGGTVDGSTATPQRLLGLDLRTLSAAFSGLDISVTATPDAVRGGDGLVNVGGIFTRGLNGGPGLDLGDVTVQGSLMAIRAGSSTSGTGLRSLTIGNLGRFDDYSSYFSPTLVTDLNYAGVFVTGALGAVTVNGDLNHANISATSIGDVTIHGNISPVDSLGYDSIDTSENMITSAGNINSIAIDGDVRASSTAPHDTALIKAVGHIGTLAIGGSFIGGQGGNSGQINAAGIGSLQIGGDLVGSTGPGSGAVSAGSIDSLQIGGDLVGGDGVDSGHVGVPYHGNITSVWIGGSLRGGKGADSGEIYGPYNPTAVEVAGDVVGGSGAYSGSIVVDNHAGTVTVDGSVFGGAGNYSGYLYAISIDNVNIGGNLVGGAGASSGRIFVYNSLGTVVVGGSITSGTGTDSGSIYSAVGTIGTVIVYGDLNGTAANPVVLFAGKTAAANDPSSLGQLDVYGSASYARVVTFRSQAGTSFGSTYDEDFVNPYPDLGERFFGQALTSVFVSW